MDNKNQQLFQIQNILETLLEATQHLSSLVKKRELNQSIYSFSSIVEGTQAIIPTLIALDKDFTKQTKKLENNLSLIANHLEKGNVGKIPEILQFSLHPLFVRMIDMFKAKFGNQKVEKTVRIGVFHSWANPREFYPQERIDAMINASTQQDAVLYFFTSDDIDFDNEKIKADFRRNNQWERITVPFPDVINNVGAGKKSQAERKLSRIVPFTSFHVGNKYTLPKRMAKHRKFADLLVPFRVCADKKTVDDFIEKNERVVFKSLGSNRGENIYFVTKKGSRYVILEQKKERIMNSEDFHHFVENTILGEKNAYIIQKYIHTRTKADEPYHFRAHVQKNGEGKWQLVHIYASIGSKKGNLSNISAGGRVEGFSEFLQYEIGKKQAKVYEEKILHLSVDIAIHLDKLYCFAISELGLDFAIDDNGRIWMHEANNGPQTYYFEDKRAIYTVAYAKYIAENGIMYTNSQTLSEYNQFQAQNSQLPYEERKHQRCIGMMTGKEINEKLTAALQETAEQSGYDFYYFRPIDVDFDRELIKAYFLEDGKWVPKITTYPDAIIDYVKLRGKKDASYIYEEFGDIPFTNRWPLHRKIRTDIYEQLQQENDIAAKLVAFEKVRRPYDVIRFIEDSGSVVLKPQETNKYITYSIRYQPDNSYTVSVNGHENQSYSENGLKNYIKRLIKENGFIMHEKILSNNDGAKEAKLHLMLNDKGKWDLVQNNEDTQPHIIEEAKNIAIYFASVNEGLVSEMIVTLIVKDNQIIKILDIDPNGIIPHAVRDNEGVIAKATIAYAGALIK